MGLFVFVCVFLVLSTISRLRVPQLNRTAAGNRKYARPKSSGESDSMEMDLEQAHKNKKEVNSFPLRLSSHSCVFFAMYPNHGGQIIEQSF